MTALQAIFWLVLTTNAVLEVVSKIRKMVGGRQNE